MDKTGKTSANQACFNNPKAQERNLEVVKHLVRNYPLDGLILDDNFELQNYECFCGSCKDGFRHYCARHAVTYQDPAQSPGSGPMTGHWVGYKLEATRNLATQVARIAHERALPAGGWVSVGMRSAHLAPVFDFLGGMVYSEPPGAARLMLSALGDCKFMTLLWGPNQPPEGLELEFRQAVRAGSRTAGFWVYPPGHPGGGGAKMLPGGYEAIARAFAGAENEWLKFYRENVLTGDPRFAIVHGTLGTEEMSLWADYDPRQEPLDAKVVREWEDGGIVLRYVLYRIGTFKGVPARMAAFYAFPKNGNRLPGLLHLHGGGQRAFLSEVSYHAQRGYACLSINWGGREMENARSGSEVIAGSAFSHRCETCDGKSKQAPVCGNAQERALRNSLPRKAL